MLQPDQVYRSRAHQRFSEIVQTANRLRTVRNLEEKERLRKKLAELLQEAKDDEGGEAE